MSALNAKSRLTAMSTQYSNPMAARPSKKQVYGKKGGRRRLDPLKKRRPRSPSPELCSAHRLPNPVQYIFAPEEITKEEIERFKKEILVIEKKHHFDQMGRQKHLTASQKAQKALEDEWRRKFLEAQKQNFT